MPISHLFLLHTELQYPTVPNYLKKKIIKRPPFPVLYPFLKLYTDIFTST